MKRLARLMAAAALSIPLMMTATYAAAQTEKPAETKGAPASVQPEKKAPVKKHAHKKHAKKHMKSKKAVKAPAKTETKPETGAAGK